jgi:hypothetical protein
MPQPGIPWFRRLLRLLSLKVRREVFVAFTRAQAYDALASLNPAQMFLDSYRVKPLPENLDIYFGAPEEFFIAPDTQEVYTRNRLVPILDDGNFGIVTFLDSETGYLVQLDVESPDESRATFRHWQQYLADLMIRIGESVDDDEQVHRMAKLVGFAHTDELFAYFARRKALSGAAWWEARRKFLLGIPA